MRSWLCRIVLFSFALFYVVLMMSSCGGGRSNNQVPTIPPTQTITLGSAGQAKGIMMGAAANSLYLSESAYTTTLAGEYKMLEPEWEMEFGPIHPRPNSDPQPYDFSRTDQLVNFAAANNMSVRGCCLLWDQLLADWLTNGIASGSINSAQLNTILQQHIQTVGSRYAGKVIVWDVVNEGLNDDGTMRSTLWYDQPGIGFAGQGTAYIEQAFRWAHAADPAAKLFYNDYNAEPVDAKSDAIYAMAQDFKTRGVPLDGIGFQLHVDLTFDNPATLASLSTNLQRFAALGLELHITELDIRLQDSSAASLTAQAKLYGEIAAICVQQPSCKVFQTWGFTDKYSWIPGVFPGWGWALPFDENYSKKPAYTALLEALQGK